MSETLLESIQASLKSEASEALRRGDTRYAQSLTVLGRCGTLHDMTVSARLSTGTHYSYVSPQYRAAQYVLTLISGYASEMTVAEAIEYVTARALSHGSLVPAVVRLSPYAQVLVACAPHRCPYVTPLDSRGNVPEHYTPRPASDYMEGLRDQTARAIAASVVA